MALECEFLTLGLVFRVGLLLIFVLPSDSTPNPLRRATVCCAWLGRGGGGGEVPHELPSL